MDEHVEDRTAIRESIERWAIWRDQGDWDRLASLWHTNGRMVTTWCTADAATLIARSRQAWDRGMTVFHLLGGGTVDVCGDRAIAETRMQIVQRGAVHGVNVDVTCIGRFWDAWQRDENEWLLRLRQPIYELDWMRPVDCAETVALDPALLDAFPIGYRHLAYLQTELGLTVSRDLPGTRGAAMDRLRDLGGRWLADDLGAMD